MKVKTLTAGGYKNLEDFVIEPHHKYNLINGMNAQGKTNLLETIWLMTGCKSFRGSKDRDLICLDKGKMEIGMSFDDGRRIQTVEYGLSRESIKEKKLKLNGVPLKTTGRLFDAFKAVVFTPEDTDLVKGGPEKRRSFTDLCCSQLSNGYLDKLRRYDHILSQRNTLLKSISAGTDTRNSIDVWNMQMGTIGTLMSKKRYEYIKLLDKTCRRLYSRVTGEREVMTIEYSSNIYGNSFPITDDGNKAAYLYFRKLEDSFEDDLRLGYTVWGAHRDDLVIKINGLNIREFGSQGQKKTAALCMKLGQAELYYKSRQTAPVILLDDVMGELDEERQSMVFDTVKDMQVFVTACNENAVKKMPEGKVFRVESGRITEV